MSYSRGWLHYRLKFMLPRVWLTTAEVRAALKISDRVLRRWLTDQYFQTANVAEKKGTLWYWHRERLRLWVLAMVKFPLHIEDEDLVASNPKKEELDSFETLTPEQAREELGIPAGYTLREHEE